MSGPAVTIALPPRITPREERVLRYHWEQIALALIAAGLIEPADPATGAWWRAR